MIYADAQGDYASAYGILTSTLDGDIEVTSTGQIIVTAEADSLSGPTGLGSAYAHGISTGSVYGTIHSAGLIDVYAFSESDTASAYGMVVGQIYGDVTNSGDILVEAYSEDHIAYAYGQSAITVRGFSLHNTGLIDVRAEGEGNVEAFGQYASNGVLGLMSNSGILMVEAYSNSGDAVAFGQRAGTVFASGRIENSGLIDVDADASQSAYGYGISVDSAVSGAMVSNSGEILVHAAVSKGRCNTGFKFLCWRLVLQGLSRALVKLACNSAELSLTEP